VSESFSVHFVFEATPSAAAVAEAVGAWNDADLLSAGVGATGGVDPATADDAVAAIGRDRVLDAPAPHVRELDDGSVLVAASETPTLYADGPHAIGPVADHLGIDQGDRE